jgi:DNA-binding response OmpR family regulator
MIQRELSVVQEERTVRRVLLVEDEPQIAGVVRAYLAREGYEVEVAGDGAQGLEAFRSRRPDAVILDLMLPVIDGFEVCRQIRLKSDVPIIMLTARVEEIDRVLGLELGADDYVSKPFSPRELVARLRAVMRRYERGTSKEVLRAGELELDVEGHSARVGAKPLSLTPAEFAILEKMMREPGRVFDRQQLLDAFDSGFEGYDRNADTHIKNLRKKIGEHTAGPYIHTVYGVGYKLEPPSN